MGRKIGALWKNNNKPKTHLTGVINLGSFGEQRVAVFKNEKKHKENQPNYHILLSEPVSIPAIDNDVPF